MIGEHPRYRKYENNPVFHQVVKTLVNLALADKMNEIDFQDAVDVAREILERERMEKLLRE